MITSEAIENSLESHRLRTLCKLMMARATSKENAIDPVGVLNLKEIEVLPRLLLQGVLGVDGTKMYLSMRGKLQANLALETVAKDIYEES